MADEMNNVPQQEQELEANKIDNTQSHEKEEAGWLGIGASMLFPIAGVFIYFIQRKEVNNPGAYLWAAFAGFAIGFILRTVSGELSF